MTMMMKGMCLCGAIQFQFLPKSMNVHACHCGMCRRHGGCASMTIESAEGLPNVITGTDLLTIYPSSEWGERTFCSKCGTHLFVAAPNFGYYGVSAGAVDDEHSVDLIMDSEIFIDKKPNFYSFVGDRTRVTEAEFLAMVSGEKEGESCNDQANAPAANDIKETDQNKE